MFTLAFSAYAENANSNVTPEEAFKKLVPQIKAEHMKETFIKGLYEVVILGGSRVIYFHPESGAIIVGTMQKEGVNLTEQRLQELMEEKVAKVPLDKAIKIGSGKNKVIEFTDPDCPFCRKAADYLKNRKDVTRYVFLFPLVQLHPKAPDKVKHIYCSEDRAKALEQVMAGEFDNKELTLCKDEKIDKLIEEVEKIGQEMGVSGTPLLIVEGKVVQGANIPRIEQIIGKADGTASKSDTKGEGAAKSDTPKDSPK